MRQKRGALKLQVLAPCSEDWNGMPGGDDIRFCGRCRQNVYNLSAMNETQVRALVQGPVCVRFFERGDGTVITRRCSPMLEAARRRLVAMTAGLLPLAAGFWGSVAWLRGMLHVEPPMVQGGITAVPRPAQDAIQGGHLRGPDDFPGAERPPEAPRRPHKTGKMRPATRPAMLGDVVPIPVK
jgi:hypothetical protein